MTIFYLLIVLGITLSIVGLILAIIIAVLDIKESRRISGIIEELREDVF